MAAVAAAEPGCPAAEQARPWRLPPAVAAADPSRIAPAERRNRWSCRSCRDSLPLLSSWPAPAARLVQGMYRPAADCLQAAATAQAVRAPGWRRRSAAVATALAVVFARSGCCSDFPMRQPQFASARNSCLRFPLRRQAALRAKRYISGLSQPGLLVPGILLTAELSIGLETWTSLRSVGSGLEKGSLVQPLDRAALGTERLWLTRNRQTSWHIVRRCNRPAAGPASACRISAKRSFHHPQ